MKKLFFTLILGASAVLGSNAQVFTPTETLFEGEETIGYRTTITYDEGMTVSQGDILRFTVNGKGSWINILNPEDESTLDNFYCDSEDGLTRYTVALTQKMAECVESSLLLYSWSDPVITKIEKGTLTFDNWDNNQKFQLSEYCRNQIEFGDFLEVTACNTGSDAQFCIRDNEWSANEYKISFAEGTDAVTKTRELTKAAVEGLNAKCYVWGKNYTLVSLKVQESTGKPFINENTVWVPATTEPFAVTWNNPRFNITADMLIPGKAIYVHTDGKCNMNLSGDWDDAAKIGDLEKVNDNLYKLVLTDENLEGKSLSSIHFVSGNAKVYSVDYGVENAYNHSSVINWGTLIVPFDCEIPSGMTVYECTEVGADNVLVLIEQTSIKANTPYLIEAEAESAFDLAGLKQGTETSYSNGFMTGVYEDTDAPIDTYVLQKHGEVAGFYHVSTTQPTVKANHCYINALPAPVQKIKIRYSDGNTSMIMDIENSEEYTGEYFNVNGQRVDPTTHKGLMIGSGCKKVNR